MVDKKVRSRADLGRENMMMRTIIATHHRCASTWMRGMIENIFPDAYISHRNKDGGPNYFIVYLNADYDFLERTFFLENYFVLHIIRNPFDLIVSAYYSHLNEHSRKGWPALTKQRRRLQEVDKVIGFQRTMEFLERPDFYDENTPGPLYALDRWNFDDRNILTVRMEDLVAAVPFKDNRNASDRIGTWDEELPLKFIYGVYKKYKNYVDKFYPEMVKGL